MYKQSLDLMPRINIDVPVGALKTQLSKLLLAVDRVGWNTGATSGRFDVRRSSRLLAGSERVFKKRYEQEATATAVSVIVDISSSMTDGAPDDMFVTKDASPSRIGLATQCAYAIATAVERSNCFCEVVGFGSTNSNRPLTLNQGGLRDIDGVESKARVGGDATYKETRLFQIKAFDQKAAQRRRAFEYLYNACEFGTADYQAVRTVVEQLAGRPEPRKIALVLTDGAGDYDILKRFCEMSEKLYDIPVLAIGVQAAAHDMDASYKRFAMVGDLRQLSETAIRELIAQIDK